MQTDTWWKFWFRKKCKVFTYIHFLDVWINSVVYRQLYCITHVDQRTQRRDSKKTSTNSLRCSQEVEHSISIESNISEDSLRSVSSSYSSQTSMGSIDETDTGGCEKQPRMQCDSGISAKLDFVSQGGSLVEFLDSGNLALAPSSGSPSGDPPPPCK